MPLGTRVDVDLRPLNADIKELQTRNASLKAIREGVKVLNNAVKGNTPRGFGHLKRAQGTKAKKGRKGKTGSFAVQGAKTKYKKPRKRKGKTATALALAIPALYDHLVLGGVKPHGVGKGGSVVTKPHPGARANPYRRRTYDGMKHHVGSVIRKKFGDEIQKIINKNAAKARQR